MERNFFDIVRAGTREGLSGLSICVFLYSYCSVWTLANVKFFCSYYDTSTISCLYGAIEDACGEGAAGLSLGPVLHGSGGKKKSSNHSNPVSFSTWVFIIPVSIVILFMSDADL